MADGDTVLLHVGTTTTAIARALVARADLRDVTVVTNGLTVALVLERAWPRISVVVTGGTLRPLQHSLVNPLGTVLLDGLNASIAFIGCNGVDGAGGVTNVNLPEAEVKRAMLLSARRPVVVADGSSSARSRWRRSATSPRSASSSPTRAPTPRSWPTWRRSTATCRSPGPAR